MARSRNIKPGFFTNDLLAEVDPLGRLLFAGLWTLADREGRLEDRPKRIKVQTLPYDNCNMDDLLDQLQEYGFVLRYEVDGNRYIQIVNWDKHQNPHIKEAASEIPAPEQAPEEHHTSTVQEQEEHSTSRADSLNLIPDSLNPCTSTAAVILTEDEAVFLETLQGVKGYPLDREKDRELYQTLTDRYPDLDILDVTRDWAAYKLDKPLDSKSNPRSQLNTACKKAQEWGKNRKKARGDPPRQQFSHVHPDVDLQTAIRRKTVNFDE